MSFNKYIQVGMVFLNDVLFKLFPDFNFNYIYQMGDNSATSNKGSDKIIIQSKDEAVIIEYTFVKVAGYKDSWVCVQINRPV